jgi:hypothetical protein
VRQRPAFDPAHLIWTRYAVAATPPVATMLAVAALLRQAYRLAETRVPDTERQLSRC